MDSIKLTQPVSLKFGVTLGGEKHAAVDTVNEVRMQFIYLVYQV